MPQLQDFPGEKQAAAARDKAAHSDNPDFVDQLERPWDIFSALGSARDSLLGATAGHRMPVAPPPVPKGLPTAPPGQFVEAPVPARLAPPAAEGPGMLDYLLGRNPLETAEEKAGGAKEALELGEKTGGSTTGNLLGGLGIMGSGMSIWKGLGELGNEQTRSKGFSDIVGGVTSGMGGLISMLSKDKEAAAFTGGALNIVGGGVQAGTAWEDHKKHGWTGDNAIDLGAGGLTAATGAATMAGAAPLAAVLGAGNAGLTIGKTMNDVTEATSRGYYGKGENGYQKTASDDAADTGVDVEQWLQKNLTGSTGVGGTVANGVGFMASLGTGLLNMTTNPLKHVARGVGGLFSHFAE